MLLGHRLYDPSTGRFLTRDPIQDGRNWYVYCGNDPLSYVDNTGLSGKGWWDRIRDFFNGLFGRRPDKPGGGGSTRGKNPPDPLHEAKVATIEKVVEEALLAPLPPGAGAITGCGMTALGGMKTALKGLHVVAAYAERHRAIGEGDCQALLECATRTWERRRYRYGFE
jgi:hypothetical protein